MPDLQLQVSNLLVSESASNTQGNKLFILIPLLVNGSGI